MKRLFSILLFCLPFFSFSQCVNWLNNSPEESKALLPKIQQYLLFDLKKINSDTTLIEYADNQQFCTVKFRAVYKKELQGTTLVSLPPFVKNIYISGPADRIDKLFESLKEEVAKCQGYATAGQWVRFNKMMMVWHTEAAHKEIPIKSIYIENDGWTK